MTNGLKVVGLRTKEIVRRLLSTHVIGRPCRKILWLSKKLTLKILNTLELLYKTAPYMLVVGRQLQPDKLLIVAKHFEHLKHVANDLPLQPKISVLIPVYRVSQVYLRECLNSVAFQLYANWEICAVDDASGDPEITKILSEFQSRFGEKFKSLTHAKNGHISATSNSCLALATGDYVVLLDNDDRLYPNSLAEVVTYINLHQGPDILYSDERLVDAHGEKVNPPFHKPAWSPWLHASVNYTTHLSVYRRSLLNEIGGFRVGYEGSQDHDLMLRAVEKSIRPVIHIPSCLYQWRAHAGSTAQSTSSKPYAANAGEKAVAESLFRRGFKAKVVYEPKTVHYKIDLELPSPRPLVSIVIPSKEAVELLDTCIQSIFTRSTYTNIEIIVSDNGSTSPECLAYYEQLKRRHPTKVKTLIEPGPFNFARQCNIGAKHASGEVILFLNNDTEIQTPGWIEQMLPFALLPEIAAVGCKLLYPDNTIQHAGIMTAGRDVAIHAGLDLVADDNLYWNMLNTLHEVSAVTAACMIVRKSIFFEIGAFDEHYFPNGYGDVEFCLRARGHGKSILYTPYAVVIHAESKTRGKSIEYFERHLIMTRHGTEILNDPYLNPNLERDNFYKIDQFYEALDLNGRQMAFFLNTPQALWISELRKKLSSPTLTINGGG
jgi:O-antigen biosynthesis protein